MIISIYKLVDIATWKAFLEGYSIWYSPVIDWILTIFQVETEEPVGPKGKYPWITLNGEDHSDSSFIIDLLAKKFDKNFSSQLTEEQKGVARTLQVMVEEHIYW